MADREKIYKFIAVVDEVECMDEDCVIFCIRGEKQLPSRHCFVKNEILANALVVIGVGKELKVSARFMSEKNYMYVTDISEAVCEKENTVVTRYKTRTVGEQSKIDEPFEILINNTPAILSDQCISEAPLIEGRKYIFTYVKKTDRLEITKIESCEAFTEWKNPLAILTSKRLAKINCFYDTDLLTEDEEKINSLRSYVDLCVSEIGDKPGMITGAAGTVEDIEKTENKIAFKLKLTDEEEYKCVIIRSAYAKSSLIIEEGKRYYITGILSDGVIRVLLTQRLIRKK